MGLCIAAMCIKLAVGIGEMRQRRVGHLTCLPTHHQTYLNHPTSPIHLQLPLPITIIHMDSDFLDFIDYTCSVRVGVGCLHLKL